MPDCFPSVPAPPAVVHSAFVYILQCADGSFYTGQTCDVPERIRKHGYGMGSKFTRDHATVRLVFWEGPMSPRAAVSREAQLKRWSRAKKEALIRNDIEQLKSLARSRSGMNENGVR